MLSSSRVILTPLLRSDISEEYLESLNDQDHMKYSRNSTFTHTLNSQVQYVESFSQSNDLLFGVKSAENGKLLGTINCYINFTDMTLNLGFLIFKNQQGKGYTSEALELLIPYLEAQFPGMTAVICSNRNNFGMHKVAKKLNFRIENRDFPEDDLNLRFVRNLPQFNSEVQPIVPAFVLNAKRIGVAANDAGGAEQISWLLRNIPRKVLAYIDGPAVRIFENSGISFNRADQLSDIMDCDLIITGSGWMSQLEINVIKEARLREIPCLTILDHWVNYCERFGKDQENLPQILGVTNHVALKIAQEKFPNKVVWLLPDFQVKSYKEILDLVKNVRTRALILLEPASTSDSFFVIDNKAIQNLIESAVFFVRTRGLSGIIIRPHPSQVDELSLLEKLKEVAVECEVSKGGSLLEDLEVSQVVLGLSSYALYISSMCEIETYSQFAGMKGHWTERFPKISLLPTSL
jgi:RimJ/RimL family protein N-acetyltransferase